MNNSSPFATPSVDVPRIVDPESVLTPEEYWNFQCIQNGTLNLVQGGPDGLTRTLAKIESLKQGGYQCARTEEELAQTLPYAHLPDDWEADIHPQELFNNSAQEANTLLARVMLKSNAGTEKLDQEGLRSYPQDEGEMSGGQDLSAGVGRDGVIIRTPEVSGVEGASSSLQNELPEPYYSLDAPEVLGAVDAIGSPLGVSIHEVHDVPGVPGAPEQTSEDGSIQQGLAIDEQSSNKEPGTDVVQSEAALIESMVNTERAINVDASSTVSQEITPETMADIAKKVSHIAVKFKPHDGVCIAGSYTMHLTFNESGQIENAVSQDDVDILKRLIVYVSTFLSLPLSVVEISVLQGSNISDIKILAEKTALKAIPNFVSYKATINEIGENEFITRVLHAGENPSSPRMRNMETDAVE